MSSYYFKNTKYNTIGYSHLRDIQSKRDKFTVLPEFGITVFDADNPPFERDNNYRVHDVYAHIPGIDKSPRLQKLKLSQQFQKRVFASIRSDPSRLQYLTPSERVAYQANQSRTTMYKRKAPSNAYNNARFDAEFGPSAPVARKRARTELQMRAASQQAAWQQKASLATQVRRLIQGKKKDAADVDRVQTSVIANRIHCLSSSTSNATAADTTGLVVTDADRAHINSVTIRGTLNCFPLVCTSAQAATAKGAPRFRMITVWFYKPKLDASAAGTLPPLTEVLEDAVPTIDSMYKQDAKNANSFVVLSDRLLVAPRMLQLSDASLGMDRDGQVGSAVPFNYTVKVNKEQFYAAPCNSTNKGGHFDSDTLPGQVTKGLLVLYTIADGEGSTAGTSCGRFNYTLQTRLNYTA